MKARPGKLAKLQRKRDSPYTVTHVYTNGTLRIRKGVVAERISVRRVSPYYETEQDTLPHSQLAVWEADAV
jgi:hypothetical protein